ncbi:unnamed protein product [Adineta ricciae]|uniref:Protein quiver n=1 Tax=Adineta ricciae TaxID=249248 RepID=A0A815MA01_ADIRI|nr:unnamed protein product [Adineta ricciae]
MFASYFLTFAITWICLIEAVSSAAGWCYQCDYREPNCQLNVDPTAMAHMRVPCNGQCYIRIKENQMFRGCSWEYGFMQRKVPYTLIYEQEAVWIFCDTALCNVSPNASA